MSDTERLIHTIVNKSLFTFPSSKSRSHQNEWRTWQLRRLRRLRPLVALDITPKRRRANAPTYRRTDTPPRRDADAPTNRRTKVLKHQRIDAPLHRPQCFRCESFPYLQIHSFDFSLLRYCMSRNSKMNAKS